MKLIPCMINDERSKSVSIERRITECRVRVHTVVLLQLFLHSHEFYKLHMYALCTQVMYYFIRKSAAKARSPGTSQRAIAVSIFALISEEALGLRPIACIAPIPISPIPTPEPITPISAKAVYIKEKGKNNKWFPRDYTERKYPIESRKKSEKKAIPLP